MKEITSYKRKEVIGDATLYLGDCLPILSSFQNKEIDAVVTDPPYGIGKDGQTKTTGGNGGRKYYEFKGWDIKRPSARYFFQIMRASKIQIIWGGNYFTEYLPPTGKWLVWDKGQRINQSDGELAFTSLSGALRILSYNRVFLMTDGAEHPTQKPVGLMKWCLEQLPYYTEIKTVCDPFMGSGTTGIACLEFGYKFIGVERDEDYFDIACKRIEQANKQLKLFT